MNDQSHQPTPPPPGETPTPRTDAEFKPSGPHAEAVYSDFARTLERELTDANTKLHTLARCVDLSERIMESSTEKQIALMTDFNTSMQQVVLTETERELAAAQAAVRELCGVLRKIESEIHKGSRSSGRNVMVLVLDALAKHAQPEKKP